MSNHQITWRERVIDAPLEKCGLWWKPPNALRMPPMHLSRFYGVVSKDKGLKKANEGLESTYCKRIPNSDQYLYLRESDFAPDKMIGKPFFHLKHAYKDLPLSQQVMLPERYCGRNIVYCRVGNQKCVLKITTNLGSDDESGPEECFMGLIASIFWVGPSVLDFWSVPIGDGRYLVYSLMEYVDMSFDRYTKRLMQNADQYKVAFSAKRALLEQMVTYLQVYHTDWHPGNLAVYNNERLCLLDWERTFVYPDKHAAPPVVDDEYKTTDRYTKHEMYLKHMMTTENTREMERRAMMPMHHEPYRLIDVKNKTSKVIDDPAQYAFMDTEQLPHS